MKWRHFYWGTVPHLHRDYDAGLSASELYYYCIHGSYTFAKAAVMGKDAVGMPKNKFSSFSKPQFIHVSIPPVVLL